MTSPEVTPPPAPRKQTRKRYAAASATLGAVLAAAGLYFVVSKIVRGWSDYGDTIRHARWGWIVLGLLLAFLGMATLGQVWRSVLASLGARVSRRNIFIWYQLGNLGKYVPGGIFQVLGRGELATRGGVTRSVAYNSVALSMGATYVCGALVSAVLLPFALLEHGSIRSSWWVFLIIPLGLACLRPGLLDRVFRLAEKAFGGSEDRQVPSWTQSVRLVSLHTPGWLLNGLACYVVTLTFDPSPRFFTIVFAGIVSWVAGFVVIFAPSGLGVREAMFVAITQASLGGSTAATVAIISRLVFVAGDALGATIAAMLRLRYRRGLDRAARHHGRPTSA
ncbi:MAG: flippase-like domain-containing protein [Actinomycetia bacterium]|nr:flippase-like domain-containing protein [Actinomycetes bacterium]